HVRPPAPRPFIRAVSHFSLLTTRPALSNPPMSDARSALKAILLEKSVRTGTFTLASGKESDLYIDCRVTALDPFGANLIGELGWATVRDRIAAEKLEIHAIGGMTLG